MFMKASIVHIWLSYVQLLGLGYFTRTPYMSTCLVAMMCYACTHACFNFIVVLISALSSFSNCTIWSDKSGFVHTIHLHCDN